MTTISREHVICAMSSGHAPVCHAHSGDTLVFETWDCYGGVLLPEGSTFADLNRELENPATGPVFIEGAVPGDMLKIEIIRIELDPVGILDKGKTSGALAMFFPNENEIYRVPVTDGRIVLDEKRKFPILPMIGVIGNAPAEEIGAVETMTPMEHGGNMDCTKITEGATLYLPVFAEGGLLSMGDLHAAMGDGEVGNCGVEIGGKVTVRVSVEKQLKYRWPLLIDGEHLTAIGCGDSLDEAAEKAVRQMFEYLCETEKLSMRDAGLLLDMAGNLVVCQIVNPLKTVRMEVPLSWLRIMKNQ